MLDRERTDFGPALMSRMLLRCTSFSSDSRITMLVLVMRDDRRPAAGAAKAMDQL
jgi:hypothetical protein